MSKSLFFLFSLLCFLQSCTKALSDVEEETLKEGIRFFQNYDFGRVNSAVVFDRRVGKALSDEYVFQIALPYSIDYPRDSSYLSTPYLSEKIRWSKNSREVLKFMIAKSEIQNREVALSLDGDFTLAYVRLIDSLIQFDGRASSISLLVSVPLPDSVQSYRNNFKTPTWQECAKNREKAYGCFYDQILKNRSGCLSSDLLAEYSKIQRSSSRMATLRDSFENPLFNICSAETIKNTVDYFMPRSSLHVIPIEKFFEIKDENVRLSQWASHLK